MRTIHFVLIMRNEFVVSDDCYAMTSMVIMWTSSTLQVIGEKRSTIVFCRAELLKCGDCGSLGSPFGVLTLGRPFQQRFSLINNENDISNYNYYKLFNKEAQNMFILGSFYRPQHPQGSSGAQVLEKPSCRAIKHSHWFQNINH